MSRQKSWCGVVGEAAVAVPAAAAVPEEELEVDTVSEAEPAVVAEAKA
jgi:hypothetical protein